MYRFVTLFTHSAMEDYTMVATVTPITFVLGAFCAIIPGFFVYFCFYKVLKRRRVDHPAAVSNPVTSANARPNIEIFYEEITLRYATDSSPSSAQLELKENVAYGQF